MPSTYVLIPGAGGDAFYWHRVVPALRARGHDAIAVDLPSGDDGAGLADYAGAVVAAIGDRAGVILVAQSMAAFSAPLVCARVAVERLLLVAPMIPAPGETAGAWWDASGQTAARRANEAREGRDPDAPFDLMTTFLHDVPPEVVDALLARPEPRQSGTPFGEPWPLRGLARRPHPRGARPPRPAVPARLRAAARARAPRRRAGRHRQRAPPGARGARAAGRLARGRRDVRPGADPLRAGRLRVTARATSAGATSTRVVIVHA